VLLRIDLHRKLGRAVAFLKTPNYGLEPTDIRRANVRRVDHDPAPSPAQTDTFTLQQLMKPSLYKPDTAEFLASRGNLDSHIAFEIGLSVDAQFQDTGLLPPVVVLDYAYGVAAYRLWRSQPANLLWLDTPGRPPLHDRHTD